MKNRLESQPEPNKGDKNPSLIRREVRKIPAGGDKEIEITYSEIKEPEEFLKFKPKNSSLTDKEWLNNIKIFGIEHTINHDWQDWEKNNAGLDEPWFGKLEEDFIQEHGPSKGLKGEEHEEWYNKFSKFILENLKSKNLDQLGNFGKWATEAEITDINLLARVAKEFLED